MQAAEFRSLSPSELRLIWVSWLGQQRRLDLRAAMICCSMAGGHPADYFPSLDCCRPPFPSDEQMASKIDQVLG